MTWKRLLILAVAVGFTFIATPLEFGPREGVVLACCGLPLPMPLEGCELGETQKTCDARKAEKSQE